MSVNLGQSFSEQQKKIIIAAQQGDIHYIKEQLKNATAPDVQRALLHTALETTPQRDTPTRAYISRLIKDHHQTHGATGSDIEERLKETRLLERQIRAIEEATREKNRHHITEILDNANPAHKRDLVEAGLQAISESKRPDNISIRTYLSRIKQQLHQKQTEEPSLTPV